MRTDQKDKMQLLNGEHNKQLARKFHANERPGKIEVVPTKPYSTQKYLSLAYSPGVAETCLDIIESPEDVYKYTIKGNLVGVITNGTAVLGLGDIGSLAAKPVMEGKALLFKTFADIDVFDIEVSTLLPDRFVSVVSNISNTFGAINLEDIKAPECFEIEERLMELLDIPVMHDDQHGTAIITTAALLNALEVNGKDLKEVRIVINGAGAAAIASARMYVYIGVPPENIVMCDSKGVIRNERYVGEKSGGEVWGRDSSGMSINSAKAEFATKRDIHTLAEAINGADVFLGLSKADLLTVDMLESMAQDPIVFALANPNPEIKYELAINTRNDIIFGTGRSDFPNQINNVLGFPYIFRGALDMRARKINNQMKLAAAKAIAELAHQPVPDSVLEAYQVKRLEFGRQYLLPKPLDYRLISEVSCAVAKAAVATGVARVDVGTGDSADKYWAKYKLSLQKRLDDVKGICYRCKKGVEV